MMKSLPLAVAFSSLVTQSFAEAPLKVVNFPNVQNKPRPSVSKHRFLESRADADQVSLANDINLYAIELAVGTPAQSIQVQIDTGSSDLWFPITNSELCQISSSGCRNYGSYNPRSSSTINDLQESFSISYGDGTQINGTFVTDSVQIGQDTLKSVQFAACDQGSSQTGIQGILGIGYETNEASIGSSAGQYPNLVSSMVKQGFINTRAYSLWLNDPDSAAGNILFGGVDLDKFTGTLISMPVIPDSSGTHRELSMPLTAISFSADGQAFTFTPNNWVYPALIDSGTTLMYIPTDVAKALWKSIGATVKSGTAYLPCSYGSDTTAKMTFTFNGNNGAKIDVLLQDLLLDAGVVSNGKEMCEFLVSGGASDGLIILGDSFMRSAYLVYDLDNNVIAIAQSKFNTTSSNIQEINSNGIPSASVMSSLAGATAAASSVGLPGAGATAVQTDGNVAALETTTPVPTFSIKGAASTSTIPSLSVIGAFVGSVTILSVFGGAMMVWF